MLQQQTDDAILLEEGALYPALRVEAKGWTVAEWRITENNRHAKYYRLTRVGRRCLRTDNADVGARRRGRDKILRAERRP